MSDSKTNDDVKAGAEGAEGAAAKDAKDWPEQLKKFAYAAVGAVNLSQDDVKSFVKKLVEKGEIAKKDGEKIVRDFAEKVQKTVKRDAKKVEDAAEATLDKASAAVNQEKLAEKINTSIERMLHGMNIATRKDVEELVKQLDDLDRKVEQLVDAASGVAARAAGRKSPASHPSGSGTA